VTRDAHPLHDRLRQLAAAGPLVVAHRGDSLNHPENTLPAFASAAALGAPVQEFDVQPTADGRLVCMHDETLDRTTDAARVLGPGALVAHSDLAAVQRLDAGSWKGRAHAGARVPTLEQALAAMLPASVPMIEHKAGAARAFVDELRRLGRLRDVLLQSFDWSFVAAAGTLAGAELATGLLGPTAHAPRIDAAVAEAALSFGSGFVHWDAACVGLADVELLHRHGLWLCTYTSDAEIEWHGGATIGVDAMCTNDPGRMLARQRARTLRRRQ
jgi:glycerophosphoryl diester phosphodiesterase